MIEISLNKTWTAVDQVIGDSFFVKGIKLVNRLFIYLFIYLFIFCLFIYPGASNLAELA